MEYIEFISVVCCAGIGVLTLITRSNLINDYNEIAENLEERLDYVESLASQGKISDQETVQSMQEIQSPGIVQSDEGGELQSGGEVFDLSSISF